MRAHSAHHYPLRGQRALFNTPRNKRNTRQRAAAAAAAESTANAAAALPPSPLGQLASAVASVSLSYRPVDESKSDERADDESVPDADSDAQPPARKRRKPRKPRQKNDTPLSAQDRLDILRLHVDSKMAASIAAVFKDRGIYVPEGTIYTIFSKQSHGLPIDPQPRHRNTKYTEEDCNESGTANA
jgi:hypothetical protein